MDEEVIEQVAETPAAVKTEVEKIVKEAATQPKPTFAETEALFRQNYDKNHNRDVSKLFKAPPTKKEEAKAEVKTEVKAEVKEEKAAEVEAKPAVEIAKINPKTGVGRLKLKLALARQENENLKSQIALQQQAGDKKAVPAMVVPVEPKREDFKEGAAGDAEFLAAGRRFDKEQAAAERQNEDASREQNARFNSFIDKLATVRKAHSDWDEVTAKATVTFNPVLEGVLFSADPEVLYYFATHQRDARNLNDISDSGAVAIGNSDNVAGVLRYLAENPTEIDKLNILHPVKAQTFIGRIEAKIEANAAAAAKPAEVKVEVKEVKQPSSGADAKTEPKSGTAATEVVKTPEKSRVKPEPPAKLTGGQAPPSANWTDAEHMSIRDRERLYREATVRR